MVLEHQGLPNFQNSSLQPALQLYAAAAAHLAPRNRGGVPPWAPFLQFGVPGVFGSPFLTRPRFGPQPNGVTQSALAGLTGLSAISGANSLTHNSLNNNRSAQGPPSECSNDDGGNICCLSFFFSNLFLVSKLTIKRSIHLKLVCPGHRSFSLLKCHRLDDNL